MLAMEEPESLPAFAHASCRIAPFRRHPVSEVCRCDDIVSAFAASRSHELLAGPLFEFLNRGTFHVLGRQQAGTINSSGRGSTSLKRLVRAALACEPAQTFARRPASAGRNTDALSRGALVSSARSKVDALAEHIACETTFPDFSNASASDSNCAAASRSIETGT